MGMSIRLKNTGRLVRLECKERLPPGQFVSLFASCGHSLLFVRVVLERGVEAVHICFSICRNVVTILCDSRHRAADTLMLVSMGIQQRKGSQFDSL